MCVCMYVCMFVCMYVCMHVCSHCTFPQHTACHIHENNSKRIFVHVNIIVCMYVCIYVCMYKRTVRSRSTLHVIFMKIVSESLCMEIPSYVCMHACMYVCSRRDSCSETYRRMCMFVCMYVCISHLIPSYGIYVYVCMYDIQGWMLRRCGRVCVYLYVCVCVCKSLCFVCSTYIMYVCMYVFMCVWHTVGHAEEPAGAYVCMYLCVRVWVNHRDSCAVPPWSIHCAYFMYVCMTYRGACWGACRRVCSRFTHLKNR